jgi:hypothetical protein
MKKSAQIFRGTDRPEEVKKRETFPLEVLLQ